MSRQALWRFLAIALPTLGALIAPLPTVDLAFQLRAGSEMLAARAIPTVDAWTFTVANTPWLDQQWGAQLLLEGAYGAGGWTALVVLRAALVALAFGLLLVTIRRRAPSLPAAATALLVIAAFIVSASALALRPQLFAIVLFAAVLAILAERERHPRLVWAVPVIAAAWANLHGTFLFAPALCGLAWLADLYDRGIPRPSGAPGTAPAAAPGATVTSTHQMLLVALVSLAATLVNPFGFGAWAYVVNLTSNPAVAGRVSEWQPPNPLTASGAVLWISVLVVAALAIWRVRVALGAVPSGSGSIRRRGAFRSTVAIPWPALLTLALFGGLALVSGRGQAWWPFVAAFVVSPWIASALRGRASYGAAATPIPATPRPTPRLLRRLNTTIAAILVLAGVALLPAWRPTGAVGVPNGTLTYAPQGIAWFLDLLTSGSGRCDARIWNPQVWGSWLELEAPCARYATDSRIELYPATVWDDAQLVASGATGWSDILAAEGATVVVTDRVNEPGLDAALATTASWTRVYADCDGSVWTLAASGVAGNPAPSSGGVTLAPVSAPTGCR